MEQYIHTTVYCQVHSGFCAVKFKQKLFNVMEDNTYNCVLSSAQWFLCCEVQTKVI